MQEVAYQEATKVELPEEKYYLGEVKTGQSSSWTVQLKIQDVDIHFKIDTGADVSVIPEDVWREMGAPQLTKPQARLTSPGGELPCLGEFMANATLKAKQYSFKVVVLKGSMANSLLSRDVATEMGLVARLDEVGTKKEYWTHEHLTSQNRTATRGRAFLSVHSQKCPIPNDGSCKNRTGQDGGI